jgi:hypothetical protein
MRAIRNRGKGTEEKNEQRQRDLGTEIQRKGKD